MSAGGLQAMRAFLALAALLAGPTSAATGAARAGSAVVAVDAEGGLGARTIASESALQARKSGLMRRELQISQHGEAALYEDDIWPFTSESTFDYTLMEYKNCYGSNGGGHLVYHNRGVHTVEECKLACSRFPYFECQGIIIERWNVAKPACWLRKNLQPDKCVTSDWSHLWVRSTFPVNIKDMPLLSTPLMHIMPWFGFNANGHWLSHWKMKFNDDEVTAMRQSGRVAAHITPLTGPYSSSNPNVVRWQLTLMKLAGIEGVIINWYGTRQGINDYAFNLLGADEIAKQASAMGMKFTVCYEDWTAVARSGDGWQNVEPTGSDRTDGLKRMVADFKYIKEKYMTMPGFLADSTGEPVVLIFGPRNFKNPADWSNVLDEAFAASNVQKPRLLSLPGKNVGAGFSWLGDLPSYNETKNDENKTLRNVAYDLAEFYVSQGPSIGKAMGSASAGYQDYYVEGRQKNESLGRLLGYNGRTLDVGIKEAKLYKPPFLQLATWNDWQEGTSFEPSKEKLGTPASHFRRLLDLQQQLKNQQDEASFVKATCEFWPQIAYALGNMASASQWPALSLPCPWSCDSGKNFINGAHYSQQSLTSYCPSCSANPVYCQNQNSCTNDNEKAVAYCKNKCDNGISPASASCTGFFYQRHTNGHEICGFYNTAPNWAGATWHGHSTGSRICKLTRTP